MVVLVHFRFHHSLAQWASPSLFRPLGAVGVSPLNPAKELFEKVVARRVTCYLAEIPNFQKETLLKVPLASLPFFCLL